MGVFGRPAPTTRRPSWKVHQARCLAAAAKAQPRPARGTVAAYMLEGVLEVLRALRVADPGESDVLIGAGSRFRLALARRVSDGL